ncbi:MAG: division/cell wall cluster transcriptional repressor MraZ [Patescibacteria group bacterium]|nr:division/cell wall cluster transcriptional repressor MraZ [Patescibacteria group bacterium]
MFIGEFRHNLDEKGRLAIPAKFRNKLAEGCVVTRGVDNCLEIYPSDIWQKKASKLASLPISQKDARAYVRLTLSGAMQLDLDKQGRVTLPDYLRRYGKINKKSVVVGLYDHLEVWEENEWDKFRSNTEKQSADIVENLKDLGI